MERNEYITDAQVVKRAKAAVRLAIEKNKHPPAEPGVFQ